jgi:tetratricopeptide (TPR) repeat protein
VAVVDVFVSHAGRDRPWAEWVAWQLDRAGLSVELDYWDWKAGENFVARMSETLRSCKAMVALFSEAYFEPTRWTTEEWTAALVVAKQDPTRFVPVRIEDVSVPEILGPILAPALFGLSASAARAELLRAVRGPTRPDQEPPFPGLPVRDPGVLADNGGPQLPGVLPGIWGGVPPRNMAFTGRDAMLVRLREGLCSGGRSVVQALHGMGGVGKTQLATEYAWRFANEYDAVWWVEAEQADQLGQQLARFAVEWGVAEPGMQIGPAVSALFARLRGRGRWLVVLDNAVSQDAVRRWVPAGPGHVLVTSRDPHWSEAAARVEVDVFARSESVALLRAQVPTLPGTDADRLAEAVGDLPLAVAQAAGLIAETGMPTEEYLQLLGDSAAEVLSEGTPGSYPVPLAAAVRVSLERLTTEDQAAGQLLGVCAFLAPDPIPTRLFTAAPDGVLPEPLATMAASRLAFRRCLGRMGRYGLARITEDRIQLHRLTQAIVRDTLPPEQRADQATRVQAVLTGVDPGDPGDPVSWPGWAELLPHLRAVDLAGTGNKALRDHAWQAICYLLCRGDLHTGHQLAHQVHQAWTARLGPDDDHTLRVANHLAVALRRLARYQQARDLSQDIFDRCQRILGTDHQATLVAAGGLANDLRELGQVEAARELDKDTLNRSRRVLGPDHPTTLSSASNLAEDLRELGQVEAARELDEDTLDRFRRVLGPDHPATLTTANDLANDLYKLGQVEAARELDEDTLDRRLRVQGPDHPATLMAANDLANDLYKLGQVEAARKLDEDTLDRSRRVLGPDHPTTLNSASNLARDLHALGQHEAAHQLEADTSRQPRAIRADDSSQT